MTIVVLPGSSTDDIDYIPTYCKYVYVSSHVLFATDVVSPSFEKHTIGIMSQLLRKIGYTIGGLGNNGKGIAVPISHEMKTTRTCLGYVVSTVASLPTPNLTKPRKLLLVASGIQTEEQSIVNYVEQTNEVAMPKLEPIVIVGYANDVESCTPITT